MRKFTFYGVVVLLTVYVAICFLFDANINYIFCISKIKSPFFLKKYEKTFILTFLALLKCAHRFVDMGWWVWLLGGCEYGVGAKYRWQVVVGA